MTAKSAAFEERRKKTREFVDRLLEERREMLVLFCRVAGLEPYHQKDPSGRLLQQFCQILVDYVAAGHFELYERMAEGRERRQGVLEVAQKLYPRIARTTDVVVEFNDKYDELGKRVPSEQLAKDLSSLGEILSTRIELEDRVIAKMFSRS